MMSGKRNRKENRKENRCVIDFHGLYLSAFRDFCLHCEDNNTLPRLISDRRYTNHWFSATAASSSERSHCLRSKRGWNSAI